uniref:Putative secreted protein n=1 Tax=Anopheles darlingi TaxID=43151 RepID=A0A2M4DE69_ANODA
MNFNRSTHTHSLCYALSLSLLFGVNFGPVLTWIRGDDVEGAEDLLVVPTQHLRRLCADDVLQYPRIAISFVRKSCENTCSVE